jgi:8-oxo-dGTP diphosphatase
VLAELRGLLRRLPDRAVVCSHGDVIPALVELLADDGMRIDGVPEWGKASVWVLDRNDEDFVSARAWPPPVVD